MYSVRQLLTREAPQGSTMESAFVAVANRSLFEDSLFPLLPHLGRRGKEKVRDPCGRPLKPADGQQVATAQAKIKGADHRSAPMVERATGFEPAAFGLGSQRSTT